MKLSRKQIKHIAKFCRLFDYPYNETRNTLEHLDEVEGKIYMDKMNVFIQSKADLDERARQIKAT